MMAIGKGRGTKMLWLLGLAIFALLVLAACDDIAPPYGDWACWEPVGEPEALLFSCSPEHISGYDWTDNGDGTWNLLACESCQVGGDCPPELEEGCDPGEWAVFCGSADFAGDPACIPDEPAPADAVASSVWLAAVCEPNDGFSDDGNITIGGSLGNMDNDARLFVAAAMDGPYTPVAASGPPWVLTREAVSALAADRGAGDYRQLWFRMGESGQPAHLGSMIADRDAHMDEYCGAGE